MDNTAIDNHISELAQLRQNNAELKSLICVLRNLTIVMTDEFLRSQITSDHWNSFTNITEIVESILNKNNLQDEELDFLAEFLRFLRNSCAGSTSNQHFILNSNEILSCAKKIISCFKEKISEKELTVLKCCLQLFGNLVCTNNDAINAKSFVWNIFLQENIFMQLFEHEDGRAKDYAMMVLYNTMSHEVADHLINTKNGHLILTSVFDSLCKDLVDWGILFMEVVLKHENFMERCYKIFPHQSRMLILDMIMEHLSSASENSYFFVPAFTIDYIKNRFIQYALNIVQICGRETSDMKPTEIVRMLNLLCSASVSDSYNHVLKSNRELLETSLDTLKSVHLVGKTSCNDFSCIKNLQQSKQIIKEEIECNPSYCFKKNLIRLIGNLCYNCKDNQDLVRRLDGIPLLLDCCNLDVRNPFIMQWCILAIRNILEKNKENQAILAATTVTGDLADSALIKELGFEVCSENGKFVLKSTQSQNLP